MRSSSSYGINSSNCALESLEVWFDNLVITSVYMQAKDDNATATSEEKNNAFNVQGLYALQSVGRTRWAPLVRFDACEKSNSAEDIKEITIGLNYYFAENLRGMLEYWDRNGEGTTSDDNRLTVQVFAAF